MILCSVSIQVSLDLVSYPNRISPEICICFFFSTPVVFCLPLLELASAFVTQILSDKLKMIDSESKMETEVGRRGWEGSIAPLKRGKTLNGLFNHFSDINSLTSRSPAKCNFSLIPIVCQLESTCCERYSHIAPEAAYLSHSGSVSVCVLWKNSCSLDLIS